jgi:nitroreductase
MQFIFYFLYFFHGKICFDTMEFSELIKLRQSVRKYQDKPVEQEQLQQLVEAVRLAPSASNSQPWKLILVDDPELKDQVARATFSKAISFNKFAPEAPVLAVLTIEKPKLITQIGGWLKKREFPLIDIGIAAAHFCLQAAGLGLGTCMIGWFDEKRIKKLLHIPRTTRIGLVITLGYAAEGYQLRKKVRKDASVMSSFNGY